MDSIDTLIKNATRYLESLPGNLRGSESALLIQDLLAHVRFNEGCKEETRAQCDLLTHTLTALEEFLSTKEGDKSND